MSDNNDKNIKVISDVNKTQAQNNDENNIAILAYILTNKYN
jgi:hypothetical protein